MKVPFQGVGRAEHVEETRLQAKFWQCLDERIHGVEYQRGFVVGASKVQSNGAIAVGNRDCVKSRP